MAYSKQTWTNDVSKANATRLTHIEDGIEAAATAADDAQADATQGVSDAAAAQADATQAISDAATAQGDATDALADAATAQTTANAAQTTANAAIPAPASPDTSASLEYDGSDWVARRNFFNVLDYSADNTGTSNAATEIEDACDAAAAAGGGIVWFPPGTYKLTAQVHITSSKVRLVGAGVDSVEIRRGGAAGNIFFEGAEGSAVTLSSNVTAGDISSINFSTTGISAGDYLNIYSTETWPNTTNSSTFGEIVRVKAVTDSTHVELWSQVEEDYATTDSASIRKLTLLTGCGVEGITFTNPTPDTLDNLPACFARWTEGFTVRDCRFEGLDGPGVDISHSVDWLVYGCRFYDLTDNEASQRLGYGVEEHGCSRDGQVQNCFMRGGRHLYTNGGSNRGVPRHTKIADSKATQMTHAGFDTHIEGKFITFDNCEAVGMQDATNAYGFQMRSQYWEMNNCRASYTRTAGVRVPSTGTQGHISGGRFGPFIGSVNAVSTDAEELFISGGTIFEDVGTAINLGTAVASCVIDPSVRFRNVTTAKTGGTGVATGDLQLSGVFRAISITGTGTTSLDARASTYRIVISTSSAVTLSRSTSYTPRSGALLFITIHASGVTTAVTFDSNEFMVQGFTNPVSGKKRSAIFCWDATQDRYIQQGDWSGDI